jgi:hypothetical protein
VGVLGIFFFRVALSIYDVQLKVSFCILSCIICSCREFVSLDLCFVSTQMEMYITHLSPLEVEGLFLCVAAVPFSFELLEELSKNHGFGFVDAAVCCCYLPLVAAFFLAASVTWE